MGLWEETGLVTNASTLCKSSLSRAGHVRYNKNYVSHRTLKYVVHIERLPCNVAVVTLHLLGDTEIILFSTSTTYIVALLLTGTLAPCIIITCVQYTMHYNVCWAVDT